MNALHIDAFDEFGSKWALVTAGSMDNHNSMTVSWGGVGCLWGKPVATVYIRPNRHTYGYFEENEYFTVSFYPEDYKKALGVMGSKSGRDMDKIKELGLHLVESDVVAVPGIKELPLTIECKVIYKQKQDLSAVPADILARYYPEIPGADFAGETRDFHYAYYGEIVGAYLIED